MMTWHRAPPASHLLCVFSPIISINQGNLLGFGPAVTAAVEFAGERKIVTVKKVCCGGDRPRGRAGRARD